MFHLSYCESVFLFDSQGFTELILIDLIKIFDENELEVLDFSPLIPAATNTAEI